MKHSRSPNKIRGTNIPGPSSDLSITDRLIVTAIVSVIFSGIPLAFITGNADWLWTLMLLVFFWA
jgi:hypothetical protein